MCGIFGASGKKGEALNLHKLAILGLYNESRGTDSCGYYFNGNIVKGVGIDSNFSDFLAKNKLVSGELKANTFMGHTRKGTHGGNNEENAHPHVIKDNFVQTHNGVIKNIWELCNKNKVNHSGIQNDSIALANLLVEVGIKEILEAYKGSAALAFTYLNNPEALYLYHGASKDKENDEKPFSERPLWVLDQPEGIYYSSIPEPLDAINTDPNVIPLSLHHNVVVEIVNGVFTKHSLKIDRENTNIIKPIASLKPYNHANNHQTTRKYGPQTKFKFDDDDINLNDLISDEPWPKALRTKIGSVFYCRGKYYEVYEHNNKQGQKQLASRMLHGEYVINRNRYIVNPELAEKLDINEHRYYFMHGVMVKYKDDYENLLEEGITGYTENSFQILSKYSKYPIIHLRTVDRIGKNMWYHKGVRVQNDMFSPKFSDKSYKIKNGKTVEICE